MIAARLHSVGLNNGAAVEFSDGCMPNPKSSWGQQVCPHKISIMIIKLSVLLITVTIISWLLSASLVSPLAQMIHLQPLTLAVLLALPLLLISHRLKHA